VGDDDTPRPGKERSRLAGKLVSVAGFGTANEVAALVAVGADPNQADDQGTTPLYRAAVQGNAAAVKVLLAAGARPEDESGTGDEGLPLCAAACHGHREVMGLLIAAGADPRRREDGGQGLSAVEWQKWGV
jgi:ankyrin repeat protein